MANWTVTPGTKSTTGGGSVNNTTVDLIINPLLSNGQWSGVYIQKENFMIGGGTETGSGTCIWNTGSGSWNVDGIAANIDQVEFINGPNTGEATNHVIARCTFNNFTVPNVDTTYNLDIDENPSSPITQGIDRKVCFQLWLPYVNLGSDLLESQGVSDMGQSVMYTFLKAAGGGMGFPSIGTTWNTAGSGATDSLNHASFTDTSGNRSITRTLLNPITYEDDGYFKYKFEGTIPHTEYNEEQNYRITSFLVRRAFNGNEIDPPTAANLDGDNAALEIGTLDELPYGFYFNPANFSLNSDQLGFTYSSAYNWVSSSPNYHYINTSDGYLIGKRFEIQFNPMDVEPDPEDFCELGHTFILGDVPIVIPPAEEGMVITDVIAPTINTRNAGYKEVTVRGSAGAEYELCLQKMQSSTSIVPASTGGYYNFISQNFENGARVASNTFTIPSSGTNTHHYKIPIGSADARYEFFVIPKGTTTARDNVPTKAGDLTSNFYGTRTLTLYPNSAGHLSPTNRYETLTTDALKITLTQDAKEGRKRTLSDISKTVFGSCKTALSTGTRLVLKRPDSNINVGMYVTIPMAGNGVPHVTTVSSVRGNIITLSASSTIAADQDVRFDSPSSKLFPFTKTISANGSCALARAFGSANWLPEEAIGNLETAQRVVAAGASSGDTITLTSVNAVNTSRINTKYLQGDTIIGGGGKDYVRIVSVSPSGKTITVATAQDVSNGDIFSVIDDPDSTIKESADGGIIPIHIQGDVNTTPSPDTCTISGYLYINFIAGDIQLPINLDTLITPSGTP